MATAVLSGQHTSRTGLWVFLASDTLSFASMLFAYGVLRNQSSMWRLPSEPAPDIWTALLLTLPLMLGSLSLWLASRWSATRLFLWCAVLSGVGFLAGIYHEYLGFSGEGLWPRGLVWGRSLHASFFYTLTGLHALHVLAGLVWLLALLPSVMLRPQEQQARLRLPLLYWNFLDLIWGVLLLTLYV